MIYHAPEKDIAPACGLRTPPAEGRHRPEESVLSPRSRVQRDAVTRHNTIGSTSGIVAGRLIHLPSVHDTITCRLR